MSTGIPHVDQHPVCCMSIDIHISSNIYADRGTVCRSTYISQVTYYMPIEILYVDRLLCLTVKIQIESNQINLIRSKSSHRTVTIHIQYTNTIIQREYTVYKYIHVKHNYYMCISHVSDSVVPLYIMSVKRWVQVCTCTDLSVQIHSQSNLS